MIRVNLLGERRASRKSSGVGPARQLALACAFILAGTVAGLASWQRSLASQSERLDADILLAQQETVRLRGVLADVRRFDARRLQLQQRVGLIEQLRRDQSTPVQLLDHVSRSLPDSLWLSAIGQKGANVSIEGRSTTLIAVSDFVASLGAAGVFKKPIEIINSQVEPAAPVAAGAPSRDVIRFAIKAQLDAAPTSAPAVLR